MTMANRDQAIIDFQEKPGVNILIVSLKAAALGLNLVAANHVVLLDLVRQMFCNCSCLWVYKLAFTLKPADVHRSVAVQSCNPSKQPSFVVCCVEACFLNVGVLLIMLRCNVVQWWNPTIEEQAIDRAHRIGQTRTVHVTRITIAGTVRAQGASCVKQLSIFLNSCV